MAIESNRRRIAEASEALRSGDADRALVAGDAIIAADPTSAEGNQIRGIALTRLNRLELATSAFQAAVTLEPSEPKHLYNLAINLRDRGQRAEALLRVLEALRLDPQHPGARALIAELGGTPPPETLPDDAESIGPFDANVPRDGYGQQVHLLPFMNRMERAWSGLGYLFLAMNAVLAVLMLVHLPMGTTGATMPHSKIPDVQLKHDPLSIFVVFLYIAAWICTFMWLFVDVIDRRRKFSWFVPFLACSVPGYTVLPFALYLTLGRKMEKVGL